MNYNCANCHFLIKRSSHGSSHVGLKQREMIGNDDYSWIGEQDSLRCNFYVWDEKFKIDKARRIQWVKNENRKNICFFWPYHDGMGIQAAEILQKRAAQERNAAKDRKHTIYALWLAAFGLLANVIVNIVKFNGS